MNPDEILYSMPHDKLEDLYHSHDCKSESCRVCLAYLSRCGYTPLEKAPEVDEYEMFTHNESNYKEMYELR